MSGATTQRLVYQLEEAAAPREELRQGIGGDEGNPSGSCVPGGVASEPEVHREWLSQT